MKAALLAFTVLAALLVVLAAVFYVLNRAPDRSVDSLRARWAPAPSQFILIDGVQVHVRDEGPRDDPAPIVLLHGTGSSLHTWDGWASRLSPTRRVVRFDRPGFGLTGPDPAKRYDMASSADFTLRLLDRLGVDRFVIAGNSSGGNVAWHVALAAPQRVDRLVLVAAAGYPRHAPLPTGLRLAKSPFFSSLFSGILPRSAVENGLRGTYGDPSKVTAAIVDRSYELTLRAGNRKALGDTLRQGDAGDSARLREIETPTLILWGGRDTVIAPADADEFQKDIAGSKLRRYDALGHLPQEEDPEATVAAFLAWTKE